MSESVGSEGSVRKCCQFQEYDMIRKFPCNCYKFEHESNANLIIKEVSTSGLFEGLFDEVTSSEVADSDCLRRNRL